MSGKTTCKEVCSQCRCIVKERVIDNPDNNKTCQATIVGVINLPEECCNGNKPKPSDDCKEVFRDMGECLQKCILKVSKNNNGSKFC